MPLKLVPDNTNIGFVKLRFIAFALTLALTIGAGALLAVRGLNLGVDFVGGLTMQVEFAQPPALDTLRGRVDRVGVGDSALQEFGNPQTILIRLPLPEGEEGAVQRVVGKVRTALEQDYKGVKFARVESVSGKVSEELITDGLWAVGLSMLFVAVFTWFRFEWYFGVSTVVALVHDVVVTLGFFALTQLEFDLNIVAAVLTIIGYSLNDKVVIDDRIRENLRKYRQMDIKQIIDLSVNETLPRTVMTSVTLLAALLALLFLGPEVIFGFTAAMVLGIVVGTYSSIFVSSSLLITLGVKQRAAGSEDARAKGAERID
ncbi:MAG: protein-export rane protein SecF [Pseudomonadota bacterium]|jgi:preprotein translocase subunit SecF|uniref:protein translocase subunit SecF n=1 Tax=Sandarakinorhabdus limnophila TaxID=210512 RepID=UPI0026F13337|nr:protein translocase subunit SecF [Sandarakinorhabdus limnophila]